MCLMGYSWLKLKQFVMSQVRLDTIGASLEPDLVSEAVRTVQPDGSALPPSLVGKLRYPGATLTIAPPTLKQADYGSGNLLLQAKTLVSWAFPGVRYNQLPVQAAVNILNRLVTRAPKVLRAIESRVGAEQLEGSEVWLLLLEVNWQWQEPLCADAITEPIQPNDYGQTPDAVDISEVSLGIWRAPLSLDSDGNLAAEPNREDATLDVRYLSSN